MRDYVYMSGSVLFLLVFSSLVSLVSHLALLFVLLSFSYIHHSSPDHCSQKCHIFTHYLWLDSLFKPQFFSQSSPDCNVCFPDWSLGVTCFDFHFLLPAWSLLYCIDPLLTDLCLDTSDSWIFYFFVLIVLLYCFIGLLSREQTLFCDNDHSSDYPCCVP